jgi:chemotaxis protein methyltransferase CheR
MLTPSGFDLLAGFLKARSGLVLGADKMYLLESRLGPILKQHGLADLQMLAHRLRNGAPTKLADDVVEAMTTNESFFFRDDRPFAHVRQRALPLLHAGRATNVKLRIWSAAASTGQEAYSLAMIVDELRALLLRDRVVEIIGTDIAREPLARARAGLYTQFEVQRGLPVQMLVKHFRKEGTMWRISDALRAAVSFREWNLLNDLRGLDRFDIVFCRNVLIYFDQPTKARVLAAIARQMAPDGFLYLGGAETVIGVTDRFVPVSGEHGVYTLAPACRTEKSAPGVTETGLRVAMA